MVLFIDDEERQMDSYVQELKLSKYKVSFQHKVDDALIFLGKNFSQIELVILDIMMPPGDSFKDVNTDLGLRTGVHFYERIRQKTSETPVIILTNVSDEQLAEHFRGKEKCWFLRKEDYLPFELVQEIEKILDNAMK